MSDKDSHNTFEQSATPGSDAQADLGQDEASAPADGPAPTQTSDRGGDDLRKVTNFLSETARGANDRIPKLLEQLEKVVEKYGTRDLQKKLFDVIVKIINDEMNLRRYTVQWVVICALISAAIGLGTGAVGSKAIWGGGTSGGPGVEVDSKEIADLKQLNEGLQAELDAKRKEFDEQQVLLSQKSTEVETKDKLITSLNDEIKELKRPPIAPTIEPAVFDRINYNLTLDSTGQMKIVPVSTSLPASLAALVNRSMGTLDGLGKNSNLIARRSGGTGDEVIWSVLPDIAAYATDTNSESDPVLGRLKMVNKKGQIRTDGKSKVPFNAALSYENIPQLMFKILGAKYESDDAHIYYDVQIGERNSDDSVVWDEQTNLSFREEHNLEYRQAYGDATLLTNPGWKSAYLVFIAMGKYGEEDNRTPEGAWKVYSDAIQVTLQ